MAVGPSDVEYMARLARVALTPEEVQHLTPQLQQILDYVDQLKELDVADVPPTSHVLPVHTVHRPDRVQPSLPTDAVLSNAPDQAEQHVRVPTVISDT